ncbi:amidohydrolase [Brucella pituitosa]|uniref:M20 aminoacylase family protein n=1 Tax=Brucella pituitosa TaxID=571256 RepID=UPI0001C8787B|nr:M20 aminoacylase family protein [Brucella pituitosa]PQZ50506.1 amidohydrolase [Ochrobactrum sp. MYb19]PRA55469.1 amidohydrolase [Ochrobactrum sp. MYb68]PRA68545.1 amidohydrolase [Ochrobactrum sp. MYb18]PRA74227.1 amidohydrolase [Brucella thiophenivorans]PRA82667.1 amidohydrolase [Ochrobactrum sp. MYb29]PRA90797.1 amidohydrolase [Ochrobactrum sp. MYb14]PRA96248.1 amidohydrolase [Ochrobactrum sp. MYb15]
MNIQRSPDANRKLEIEAGLASFIDEFIALRRDIHTHPELAFKETRTSALVADHLSQWGYDVTTGVGGSGVVGTLKRGNSSKTIGIRADMDALPIIEDTGLDYASSNSGVMHACGHDGHTTILLAAARYLAQSGRFSGTVHLIFQPAEEIGAGARRMIEDGLFERFPCDAVYGLHNWPGVPAGKFGFVTGPAMASVDRARIRVNGRGGHGAEPHKSVDPVVVASSIVLALQTVVARNLDPLDMGVVTVASIHGGDALNVIPAHVDLGITIRSFSQTVREELRRRIEAVARSQAESFGAVADVNYQWGFPALINAKAETDFARQVALGTFSSGTVIEDFRPRTASEDFAFMLEQKPGTYFFIGNGDSAGLHSPDYNFNDDILLPAALFWVRLTEASLN